MKCTRKLCLLSTCLVFALSATLAFAAVPVRKASQNGQAGGAPQWKLLGRSVPVLLTANGKKAIMTREIICANQDVDASSNGNGSNPGSCDSGDFIFVFQFQSTAASLTVNVSRLSGFSLNPSDGNINPSYGVLICDDADGNDQELCTVDTNPSVSTDITITTPKNLSSIKFVISPLPSFSAGSNAEEGQGLTLFVATHQNSPVPISIPNVGIN
jgi:hypothetical protein